MQCEADAGKGPPGASAHSSRGSVGSPGLLATQGCARDAHSRRTCVAWYARGSELRAGPERVMINLDAEYLASLAAQ